MAFTLSLIGYTSTCENSCTPFSLAVKAFFTCENIAYRFLQMSFMEWNFRVTCNQGLYTYTTLHHFDDRGFGSFMKLAQGRRECWLVLPLENQTCTALQVITCILTSISVTRCPLTLWRNCNIACGQWAPGKVFDGSNLLFPGSTMHILHTLIPLSRLRFKHCK